MGLFGLVLLLVWLAVVSVGRSVAVARGGGPAPMRLGDPVGSPQWWSRVLGVVGFSSAVAAPVADTAGLPALAALDEPAVVVVGLALVGAGAALSLAGQAAMGASWRADVDPDARTPLITDGPFRFVRNPILAGVLVSMFGLGCVTPNILSIAMVACVLASIEIQVRLVEEPYLIRVHGAAYRDYATRVGRLVPGLGHLRG